MLIDSAFSVWTCRWKLAFVKLFETNLMSSRNPSSMVATFKYLGKIAMQPENWAKFWDSYPSYPNPTHHWHRSEVTTIIFPDIFPCIQIYPWFIGKKSCYCWLIWLNSPLRLIQLRYLGIAKMFIGELPMKKRRCSYPQLVGLVSSRIWPICKSIINYINITYAHKSHRNAIINQGLPSGKLT